jgi:hypothetical protein
VRRVLAGVVAALLLSARGGGLEAQKTPPSAAPFIDATASSGLDFVHINGATGGLLLPEVIGAGGALFDYDNDGDLDLFAVQSGSLDPGAAGAGTRSRLYRNDLMPGGALRFTDVTDRSGLAVEGYGMGAATGDFDNDGHVDLLLTFLGATRMFRNRGDGSFADVTQASGVADARWSTSATFFDYDRDGWLDLYVAHYVDFRRDVKRECFSAASARDYCNPAAYGPVAHRLLHNNGDGTFSDVSHRSGIARAPARGLGVVAADVNGDGWVDLYVANDGDPNQLWISDAGSGRFRDDALLAGLALSRAGRAQGSMGIDVADADRDGDDDLFVTNLDNEGNTFYLNGGGGLFEDRTVETGLFALGFTGFGARFVDYDRDGWLDLVVANGAVRHLPGQVRLGERYPLRQQNQLFRNNGRGRFTDATAGAGAALEPLGVGRGIAVGDVDNDGDVDIVIFHNSGPARLLLGQPGGDSHWLGIRAIDGRYRRDALTARVELELPRGTPPAVGRIQVDGSYASASDPRVVFGLGRTGSLQAVRIKWPDGRLERFGDLAADRYWTLERGQGERVP